MKTTEPNTKPVNHQRGQYQNFINTFKGGKQVYLEDSVLWYALEVNTDYYLNLGLHQRINFKQSYFDIAIEETD